MSAHTPGPWDVVAFGPHGRLKVTAGSMPVATVASNNSDFAFNARLIAAAPVLLAAVQAGKSYRDALAQCADDPQRMASFCTAEGDDLDTLFAEWERLSNAAIAKAGGAA